MSNFKDAKIGDTIFIFQEIGFDISKVKVHGIVLVDVNRNLFRVYYTPQDENGYILVNGNDTIHSCNNIHYSMDLQKVNNLSFRLFLNI